MGNQLGHKLTGLERLQVTGLLRLVIDNYCPVTPPVTTSYLTLVIVSVTSCDHDITISQ